ncbi:MAG TPA: BamA/TamA family outer membrane protein, partial [Gemmatimonadales bacterium]|nr:BamA/TamA family outer membrane protein [Gemmatimonadales bacterium]
EDGRDRLVDSARGGNAKFYDDADAQGRTEGFGTDVNRRPYQAPPRQSENDLPPRDWGSRWIPNTWASFGPDIGLFVGGGATLTTYGFRKYPHASRHRFRVGFASGPLTYRAEYRGDFRRENSKTFFDVLARASGIEVISFHGFGNETQAPGDNEFYRVTQDAFRLQPSIALSLGSHTLMQAGPVLKYASTDLRPDRFLASLGDVYGAGTFGQIGGTVSISHDTRDRAHAATRGVALELEGSVFPALWDVDSVFGAVRGEARTYLSIGAPLQPTLALRVGGKKLWGKYPFFEAAFIGDASTVRLGRINRYAGDASAYASAELRLAVTRFELVLPTQFGVFGLADAGRVFLEGESSDEWHTAFGGGVSLSYLERAYTFSVAVASGDERTALYLQGGFGF